MRDTIITFTVSVTGDAPAAGIKYHWEVSAGRIAAGQGTSSIAVDMSGQSAGQAVTATVEVGGLPERCLKNASCSTATSGCVPMTNIDQYGDISSDAEKARLDNFAVELENNPGARGYIVAYDGRRTRAGEAAARAGRARDYLLKEKRLDPGRVVTVSAGRREDPTIELHIVPAGFSPPPAAPTVDPDEAPPAGDGVKGPEGS